MAFNVKNDETDRLLRELTTLTGETLTDAITIALSERLQREQRLRAAMDDPDDTSLGAAIARLRSLPVLDHRSDDEILGYDDTGLPR
jgi:antitoxin VapB